MLAFVALTGARRSEVCRSRIDDFDFVNGVVHLRERKRVHGSAESIRAVDLNPMLVEVTRAWFAEHPGGDFTLAQEDGRPVSVDLAREHFRRTFDASDTWSVVKGFHAFRHSFASILAKRSVDQRVIDRLMGHQTEAMRQRYQHLFPQEKRRAIDDLLS